MNTLELFEKLKTLGYVLYLDGENVRYKYLFRVDPPKEKVTPLLEALKRNKGAVIEYLKCGESINRSLRALYLDAFKRVGWRVGLTAQPEVKQAEDELNEVWIKTMDGRTSIEEFKRTLAEWEGTTRKAMTWKS